MHVIGGCYREICLEPKWDELYGSGLRAAEFAARHGTGDIHLLSYANKAAVTQRGLDEFFRQIEVDAVFRQLRTVPVQFQYLHAAGSPGIFPASGDIERVEPENYGVGGVDCALLFSFIELKGVPQFEADTVVYDPQAGHSAVSFRDLACNCKRLAIVANHSEAVAIVSKYEKLAAFKMSPVQLARALLKHEEADVVVIKRGVLGAVVVSKKDGHDFVPSYQTDRVFGIGSGDIFSAAFAMEWAKFGEHPFVAAKTASQNAAFYCGNGGQIEVSKPDGLPVDSAQLNMSIFRHDGTVRKNAGGRIYLAGPFFSAPERWLIDEAYRCLRSEGVEVWSPSEEAGILDPFSAPHEIRTVVREDLVAIDQSKCMLALLPVPDPGTLFEIGYARSRNIPVTVYAPKAYNRDLTMIEGSDCAVRDDLASSIYTALWQAYS